LPVADENSPARNMSRLATASPSERAKERPVRPGLGTCVAIVQCAVSVEAPFGKDERKV
jgi:hypothetical protein